MQNLESLEYLKNMRCIIVSGSSSSEALMAECKKEALNIFISYGMTETCSSICGYWALNSNNKEKSVGSPFYGVDIRIEIKNIIIKSNTVMKNYFNGPLTNGIFITSDYGEFKEDLRIYGRTDNTIISGGKNIDPSEAVSAIKLIIPSCEISQFKKSDSYWGEISGICIYTDYKITPEDLKEKLRKIISDYKIPREIIIQQPKS